ncbi:MAG: Ethyl tert-butyl ether degradation EthD [Ignavibacteria bacterium]|nr:Ethyl tert-butyl ether degradation EthD [Ignavibacteria bacterium]
MKSYDYSKRDENAKVVFYVPLWKRDGITLDTFDDYWSNVHGPVCSRLPGQHQYWQFHVAHSDGGMWPTLDGISYNTQEAEQFDGIAELSFRSDDDRKTWFQAAGMLMDDEHNIFSKAIGYNTATGNSITYVDGIENPIPNGAQDLIKLFVTFKQSSSVGVVDFRNFLSKKFAPALAKSDYLLKLKLHMFEEVDNTRPPAAGVAHAQPESEQFQAIIEIAFKNRFFMERFFASNEYNETIADQPKYFKQISAFPQRTAFTFVQDDEITLAGMRGSKVADLILNIGATNQVREDIIALMMNNTPFNLKTKKY